MSDPDFQDLERKREAELDASYGDEPPPEDDQEEENEQG